MRRNGQYGSFLIAEKVGICSHILPSQFLEPVKVIFIENNLFHINILITVFPLSCPPRSSPPIQLYDFSLSLSQKQTGK